MEKINDLLKLRKKDLRDGNSRLAVCLCLDTSGSMGTIISGDYEDTGKTKTIDGKTYKIVKGGVSRLDELQNGIKLFYEEIDGDSKAKYSIEICIVTFDDTARCLRDFSTIELQPKIPELIHQGETSMGEGVNLALDLLDRRKQEYKDEGTDYFQPWLVLMTDGEPNGDQRELNRAMHRTNEMIKNHKLTLFPIGIGNASGLDTLSMFTPNRNAILLKETNFKKFFKWLSASGEKVSQSSSTGNKVVLDGINTWGERYSINTKKVEQWPDGLLP